MLQQGRLDHNCMTFFTKTRQRTALKWTFFHSRQALVGINLKATTNSGQPRDSHVWLMSPLTTTGSLKLAELAVTNLIDPLGCDDNKVCITFQFLPPLFMNSFPHDSVRYSQRIAKTFHLACQVFTVPLMNEMLMKWEM